MIQPIDVYVGFDTRQPIAYAVAAASVCRHSEMPVSITQLRLSQLPIKRRGLTEFTYSRFLVPYLSGFRGISIFIDSDVLVRGDVAELLAYPIAYKDIPVFVVPREGALQFERASVMVFNNERCEQLTPEFVADTHNKLFDLAWADMVGSLPAAWNHLVGYDTWNKDAKLIHFTKGIPVWKETIGCEFTEEWQAETRILGSTVTYDELMGSSIHAAGKQG